MSSSIVVLSIFLALSLLLAVILYIFSQLLLHYDDKIHRSREGKDLLYSYLITASLASTWYSISIFFTMYNKLLMQLWWNGAYDYPLFNTSIHMLFKVIATRIYKNLPSNRKIIIDTSPIKLLFGIGICTALDVALSNESVTTLSIPLYTTLKASSLCFTFLWGVMIGVENFKYETFLAVLLISGGLIIAVFGADQFDTLGAILCLLASSAAGLRWALLQLLIESSHKDIQENVIISLYQFAPYTLFIIPFAIGIEGENIITSKFNKFQIAIIFSIIGGFISFCLILVEMELVKKTSSVTMAVFGQMKEIAQISLSMFVFNDNLSIRSTIGIILSITAAFYYRKLKINENEHITTFTILKDEDFDIHLDDYYDSDEIEDDDDNYIGNSRIKMIKISK